MDVPQYPVGPHEPEDRLTPARRAELVAQLDATPAAMRAAVAGLTGPQLDTKYKNWSVRQIVHHLADSHVNVYVRFKLALTENKPTVKPYDEARWAELPDSGAGDVDVELALLDAIHTKWGRLLRAMTADQFARTFHHPETGKDVSIDAALSYYAWHGRHHTAQLTWLRQRHGW